jgi:hypothetical protein
LALVPRKDGVNDDTFFVPHLHVYIGRNSPYHGKLQIMLIRISLQGKNYTVASIYQSRSSYAIDTRLDLYYTTC